MKEVIVMEKVVNGVKVRLRAIRSSGSYRDVAICTTSVDRLKEAVQAVCSEGSFGAVVSQPETVKLNLEVADGVN